MVLIAAFGYFVDVFDIMLFSSVRISSLGSLGLSGASITTEGLRLLNIQLLGMVIGGFVLGAWGDRRGRLSTLLGSIFLYSLANLANAMVTGLGGFAVCRFIAGFGLAGELGAGVTLVSEALSPRMRGWGTLVIALCGVLGGVAGGLAGAWLPWRLTYLVGAGLGLGLLALRFKVRESPLFQALQTRGNALRWPPAFFRSWTRVFRYAYCLAVGAPFWIFLGILITLAPEIGSAAGIASPVSVGRAIALFNLGFGAGEVGSSLLAQAWKKRKATIWAFLGLSMVAAWAYLGGFLPLETGAAVLGFSVGYWPVYLAFVTEQFGTEQFGTDVRATAVTSLPNLVRGLGLPLTFAVQSSVASGAALLPALRWLTFGMLALDAAALVALPESFGKSLEPTNFLV